MRRLKVAVADRRSPWQRAKCRETPIANSVRRPGRNMAALARARRLSAARGAARLFSSRQYCASPGPATVCVHVGAQKDAGGSLTTPIYSSVATVWPNPKDQHIYPRYNKGPNVEVVGARVAALEGAEAGAVFASGMAAISSVLFSFLKAGDHCVMSEVSGDPRGSAEICAPRMPNVDTPRALGAGLRCDVRARHQGLPQARHREYLCHHAPHRGLRGEPPSPACARSCGRRAR